MNQLPDSQVTVTTLRKRNYFPRIFRLITEEQSQQVFLYTKLFVVSFTSWLLLFSIAKEGATLQQHLQQLQQAQQDRMRISQQITSLKQALQQYHGYRDVYYKIASLEYAMGNVSESKTYVQKALELDPNYKEARVLGAKVGI